MLVQFGKTERHDPVILKVVKFERLEVAHQNVPRQILIVDAGKIFQRLRFGIFQIPSNALLFDEQHALPEQVDISAIFSKIIDGNLEASDPPYWNAKHVEKFAIE